MADRAEVGVARAHFPLFGIVCAHDVRLDDRAVAVAHRFQQALPRDIDLDRPWERSSGLETELATQPKMTAKRHANTDVQKERDRHHADAPESLAATSEFFRFFLPFPAIARRRLVVVIAGIPSRPDV